MDKERAHLVKLLRDFDTGVLVTKTGRGDLHGRPMDIARVEEDGCLYFSASLQSPKVEEIRNDAKTGVFFQNDRQWVSLSGHAEVIRDRQLIDELWQESWKVWFPKGKASPELCLIRVVPESGEYWDVSGGRGVEFMFEAVKAYVRGKKPQLPDAEHTKVAM